MGLPFASALYLKHLATPGSPPADGALLYVKSDNLVYTKNPAGVEVLVSSPLGNAGGDLQGTYPNPIMGPNRAATLRVNASIAVNVTKSGTSSIDSVTMIADFSRVLLTAQTAPADNGIWVVASGSWTRPADFDTAGDAAAAIVTVNGGTLNGGKIYRTTFKVSDTFGTTAMSWFELSGASAIAQHGTNASFARPTATVVHWYGTATPANALPTDYLTRANI